MKARIQLIGSFLIVLLLLAGTIVGRIQLDKKSNSENAVVATSTEVSLGNQILVAKIANTDALRTKGLSGTDALPDGRAMLFVFDTPGLYGFWMVDMKYSIDMIWINKDKQVVFIKEHATPESYPETFTPTSPALYVLEVPDGFVKNHEVKVGDVVGF